MALPEISYSPEILAIIQDEDWGIDLEKEEDEDNVENDFLPDTLDKPEERKAIFKEIKKKKVERETTGVKPSAKKL